MSIAGLIKTSNTETQKSLKSIDATLKKLLIAQKSESKAANDRAKKVAQAEKRAQADGKGKNRLGGIMGTDKKEGAEVKKSKGGLGDLIKKLLIGGGIIAALGAGIKALFENGQILGTLKDALFGDKGLFGKENRERMWEGLFGTDGLFGSKNREMLWEKLFNDSTGWFGKESRTRLWNSLFGADGIFGKAGREKIWNGLFGPDGWFGSKNMKDFNNFMFGKDGIFGEKMRKNTTEFLFGQDGIFGKKNIKGAYEGMKSFFVDDADWKKAARKGMVDFFIEDAPWKVAIREGFDTVLKDVTNFTKDLLEALGGWVRQLPGFKQVGDTMDAVGGGFDWLAEGMRNVTSGARQNLGLDEKPIEKKLSEAQDKRQRLVTQLETNVGPNSDPMMNEVLERKIAEQDEIIKNLKGEQTQKLQSGGPVRVPGSGSGDKVPMNLSPGSFVLNREASNYLFRQEGGPVPTMLEPGEHVFSPGTWGSGIESLNSAIPRFQTGGDVPNITVKKAEQEGAVKTRKDNGAPSEDQVMLGFQKGGKIFLHWAATGYTGASPNYHATVQGDGTVKKTRDYNTFGGGHTSERNSEGIGISLAAMKGASPSNFGSYPVKPIQYEKMAEVTASILKGWGQGPGYVTKGNVQTHAEAGTIGDSLGNYGPVADGGDGTRWDLWKLFQGDAQGSGGNKIRNLIKDKMEGGDLNISTVDASGGGGPGGDDANVPGSGVGADAILEAAKANIGLSKGISEQCANTVRAVLQAAGHPNAMKTTTTGDLEPDGVPQQYRAPSYAASFGGTDMGSVKKNYSATGPGDIILWKGTYGQDKWGPDAITHVGIKGEGNSVWHHGTEDGFRKTGQVYPDKFVAGVTLNGSGNADGSKGTPGDGTKDGGGNKKGFLDKMLGPFAALFKGSAEFMEGFMGPLAGMAAGVGSMAMGKLVGPEAAMDMVSGGNDILSGLLGGLNDMLGIGNPNDGGTGNEVTRNAQENSDDGGASNISADGPGGGNVDKIVSSMGFDPKSWDIYANTIGAKESGNKYDPVPVGRGGGSGGHYDGRWQLGAMAKTDAARILGEKDPGHGSSGNPLRKNWIADTAKQDRFFAAYTKANYGYMMSDSKFKALPDAEKWSILGYAHNLGHAKAKEFLDTGVSGADGFGTKSVTYTKALRKNFKAAGYQEGGMVSTMLEPGETVGTLDMWNQAIPRFQSGGAVNMQHSQNGLMQRFYEQTNAMDQGGSTPIIINNIRQGGGQQQQSMSSSPSTPIPALSGGPSMSALSDIINRVSWSNVF